MLRLLRFDFARTTILILMLFGLATGCSRHETAVEAGVRTQTFHLGNSAEPADLDPHTNNAAVTDFIFMALFEGLVRLDNDGTTISPGVAERWEVSPDGLNYTLHLRADATWSNGDPVTADDFLAAFRRLLEPKLGCEGVNIVFPIAGARDGREIFGIIEIAPMRGHTDGGQGRGAGVVPREAHHLMARSKQVRHDGRADEAGGSGHEYAHDDLLFPTRGAYRPRLDRHEAQGLYGYDS
jgi:hypothetical protein